MLGSTVVCFSVGYLAVTCSVSGVARGVQNWILREIRGAILGSTAYTCFASVHLAFGRISQYFQWIRTRILRCFSPFSRGMEKCAQSVLQFAVLL